MFICLYSKVVESFFSGFGLGADSSLGVGQLWLQEMLRMLMTLLFEVQFVLYLEIQSLSGISSQVSWPYKLLSRLLGLYVEEKQDILCLKDLVEVSDTSDKSALQVGLLHL